MSAGLTRPATPWTGAGVARWAADHEHLAATAVLGAIACLWFWPLFTGEQLGQTFTLGAVDPWRAGADPSALPQRAFYIDASLAFEPWATVAREQLSSGHLPLWNPYEWGGTTLVGNMQSALFFPLNWVLLALPFGYAWGLLALAKVIVAGLGAYVLARELRVGKGGALLAGTVFMFSAPMMVWLQYPLASVFAVFPWLLAATALIVRRPDGRSAALLAVAAGLAILGGHPESTLIAVSAAGLLLLGLLAFDPAKRRQLLRPAAMWFGAMLLGACLAAVALIPFLQALGASVTLEEHALGLPSEGQSLAAALQFAMPSVFGNAEPDLYGLPFGYFGLPALLLACVALWRGRRRPAVLAMALVALVTLAAVYHVPPVIWLLEAVPPWSSSFIAERAYFVVALVGAVGAGAGLSSLARRPLPLRAVGMFVAGATVGIAAGYLAAELSDALVAPGSLKRTSIAVTAGLLIAAAVVLAAPGRLRPALAVALALAVAVVSLIDLQNLNVTLPPDQAYPAKPASVAALQEQERPLRMSVLRDAERTFTMMPNTPSKYGLESIEGYDFPLSERWSDFQTRVLGFTSPAFPEGRFSRRAPRGAQITGMRAMGVRYYLGAPGTPPAAPAFETLYDGPDAVVYRDPGALPRAYLAPRVRRLGDRAALSAMAGGRFDPLGEAIVRPGAPAPPTSSTSSLQPAAVEQPAPDHVRVRVPAGASGWLVLANAYHDNWHAEIDGRSAEIHPTNHAAMGLPVSPGARVVDFRLDRRSVWLGLVLSGLSLAIIVALWLAGGRTRRS